MNSQQYDLPDSREDLTSRDKLYSSAPPMTTSEINGEPSPRTTVVDSPYPIVPPRNYMQAPRIGMNNHLYNSYGRNPYSFRPPYNNYSYGYNSTYPQYSGYPAGMFGGYGLTNGYHMNNNSDSRFIRAAEESTRPAFQAIETMTRAVNSLSFMMESTFGSLNMSFQAILSVIENFSQARKFLKQVITSVLTLRIFHKFLLMLINLLRRMNILSEEAVANLPLLRTGLTSQSTTTGIPMWPILTFFGLMFGAPYLISRMLQSQEDTQSEVTWNPITDPSIPLIAVHNFKAGTDQELCLTKGQLLKMAPPEIMPPPSPYWVFVADGQNRIGFVPRNHVAPTS